MQKDREPMEHVLTFRVENALIHSKLWSGNSQVLASAILEYTQAIQTPGNGGYSAHRASRQGIINAFNKGNPFFSEFVSKSAKFKNSNSKHTFVNIFVKRLVNKSRPEF